MCLEVINMNEHPELQDEQTAKDFDKTILKIIADADAAIDKSHRALQEIKAVIGDDDL